MTQSNNPELSARIETALAALPPQQRAVFLALRDEGISYADLAQRLGGRKDEVEQTFVEALIALDRALDVPTSPCLVDAAARHCNARWLVKIDIESFFESIKEPYIQSVFERLGYPDLLSFQLARLCTQLPTYKSRKDIFRRKAVLARRVMQNEWIGFLPQGAPTSPQLANLVMRRFDRRMAALSRTAGLRYSRYSDDLIFSTTSSFSRDLAKDFVHQAYDVLGAFGFEANRTKTSIAAPGARKVVLGLLVDRDKPRLTRDFRANMETHLHYLERGDVGPVAHARTREFDSVIGLRNHLLGLVAFARQIDRPYGDGLKSRIHAVAWPA